MLAIAGKSSGFDMRTGTYMKRLSAKSNDGFRFCFAPISVVRFRAAHFSKADMT